MISLENKYKSVSKKPIITKLALGGFSNNILHFISNVATVSLRSCKIQDEISTETNFDYKSIDFCGARATISVFSYIIFSFLFFLFF